MTANAAHSNRLVIIESPFAGDVERNRAYALDAMRDCLQRGEAPWASHLLYPQVLDDTDAAQRAQGIEAGLAWGARADATVVYVDLGISPGMFQGIERAAKQQRCVEARTLPGWAKHSSVYRMAVFAITDITDTYCRHQPCHRPECCPSHLPPPPPDKVHCHRCDRAIVLVRGTRATYLLSRTACRHIKIEPQNGRCVGCGVVIPPEEPQHECPDCAHSLPEQPASTSETTSPPVEQLARSVSWRGTLMPARFWSRACGTAPWLLRLSGVTSSPSTAERGVESWIASWRASLALMSLWPEDAPESKETPAGFGRSADASSPKSSLPKSSSKTSRRSPVRSATSSMQETAASSAFATWDSEARMFRLPPPKQTGLFATKRSVWFSGTWPRSGSMQNGECSERPMLSRQTAPGSRTNAPASSSWPTPDASVSLGFNQSPSPGAAVRPALAAKAAQWPTPTASMVTPADLVQAMSAGSDPARPTYAEAKEIASHWATPTGADGQRSGDKMKRGDPSLIGQSRAWPTPRSSDGPNGGPNQRGTSGDLMLPSAASKWATPTVYGDHNRKGASAQAGDGLATQSKKWSSGGGLADARESRLEERGAQRHDGGTKLSPAERGGLGMVPFPPGPDDADGWAEYLRRYPGLEPAVEVNGRRVLNAAFDEALMGWPVGWTAVCGCVGPCNCNRMDRLRLCGNGVVPVQAAEAIRQLEARSKADELREVA